MAPSPLPTITGTVDARLLDKADRIFDRSLRTIFLELLQNARRAGADHVHVTATPVGETGLNLVIRDNGHGLDEPSHLIGLGSSDWNAKTSAVEDPAGCGFFSLCHLGATVRSRGWKVDISREVFLGRASAPVIPMDVPINGLEITFAFHDPLCSSVIAAGGLLESVARHGPIDVTYNGNHLERCDFLGRALMVKEFQGVRMGVFDTIDRDFLNFFGLVIRGHDFPTISNGNKTYTVRFDVKEATQLKLTLPQRDHIVQNDFFNTVQAEALRLIFEYVATLPKHDLAYADFQRARVMGVALPEADPRLDLFWPQTGSETDRPRTPIVPGPTALICQASERGIGQTILRAYQKIRPTGVVLLDEDDRMRGYSWYDQIPRITAAEVQFNGAPLKSWEELEKAGYRLKGKRPKKIILNLRIENREKKVSTLVFATDLYIPELPDWGYDIHFMVTQSHPFARRDERTQLEELLTGAFFEFSDDADADSYDTQTGQFDQDVADILNRLCFGEKRTALNRLASDLRATGISSALKAAGLRRIELRLVKGEWRVRPASSSRPTPRNRAPASAA